MGFFDIPGQVFGTIYTNKTNQNMNEQNIALQERENEKNRQFQEKWNEKNLQQTEKWNTINQENWQNNFDYQKALQEEIFNREDSAYARTVADMRQAGLSPLFMQGTNGAGQALQTSPFQGSPYNSAEAPQGVAPQNSFASDYSGFGSLDPVGGVLSFKSSINSLEQQKLNNEHQQLENDSLELDNDFKRATIEDNIAQNVAQKIISQVNASDKESQKRFNDSFHLNQGMTEKERISQIANTLVNPESVKKVHNDYITPTQKEILSTRVEPRKDDPSYSQFFRAIPIVRNIFGWSVKKSREDKLKRQNESKKYQRGGR